MRNILFRFVKPKPFFMMNKLEHFCWDFDYFIYKSEENIYFFFHNLIKKFRKKSKKEKIIETLKAELDEALFCDRVWTAWGYGTMGEDDFYNVSDDQEFIEELATKILLNLR